MRAFVNPAVQRTGGFRPLLGRRFEGALQAMAALAAGPLEERIEAGPSGACSAAALMALASAPELADLRRACGLDRSTRAFIVVTEGA